MLSRKSYEEGIDAVTSAMFIVTAYDKASEAWTSSFPSLLVSISMHCHLRSLASDCCRSMRLVS